MMPISRHFCLYRQICIVSRISKKHENRLMPMCPDGHNIEVQRGARNNPVSPQLRSPLRRNFVFIWSRNATSSGTLPFGSSVRFPRKLGDPALRLSRSSLSSLYGKDLHSFLRCNRRLFSSHIREAVFTINTVLITQYQQAV